MNRKSLKKKTIAITSAVLVMNMFGACKAAKTETTAAETAAAETTEAETETEAAQIIYGSESENAVRVNAVNGTGQDITGIYLKEDVDEYWSVNMIPEGETWADGDEAVLSYDKEEEKEKIEASIAAEEGETAEEGPAEETEETESAEETDSFTDETTAEDGPEMVPVMETMITLADGTELEMSAFPILDADEIKICYEEVAYVEYVSISTGESVSTREAELAAKELREAEETSEAETTAAAAETAAPTAQKETTAPAAQAETTAPAAAAAAAPAAAVPQTTAPAAPETTAPATTAAPETTAPAQTTEGYGEGGYDNLIIDDQGQGAAGCLQ